MIITIDYQQVTVPEDILRYCDEFTIDAKREDIRYMDCVYMHMGAYGNDVNRLKQIRLNYPPLYRVFE